MTPREKALVVFLPGLTVAALGLAWWVLDPKGDAHRHLIDRTIRLLDRLRL